MNTVTVIIPARNAADTIARAIHSAAFADEIIVCDDASSDHTLHHAIQAAKEIPTSVRIVRNRFRAGVCHTRNVAIDAAQDGLIIPLDADDYFLPRGVSMLTSAWEQSSIVYGGWRQLANERVINEVMPPPPEMLNRKTIAQATICYHKAQWQAAGGYDPDFNIGAEDHALMCAFVSQGYQLARIPHVVYAYRVSDSGRAARCARYADAITRLLHDKYPRVFDSVQSVL